MEYLGNTVFETNMTELMANFWVELTKIDENPDTSDSDVLSQLTCQRETIKSILAYGEKIEIEED